MFTQQEHHAGDQRDATKKKFFFNPIKPSHNAFFATAVAVLCVKCHNSNYLCVLSRRETHFVTKARRPHNLRGFSTQKKTWPKQIISEGSLRLPQWFTIYKGAACKWMCIVGKVMDIINNRLVVVILLVVRVESRE